MLKRLFLIGTASAAAFTASVVFTNETEIVSRESKTTAFINTIIAEQEKYKQETGRYAQLLSTHDSAPKGNSRVKKRVKQPENNLETWDRFGARVNMDVKYRIDTYENTQGHGYTITIEMEDTGGNVYQKVINRGNDTERGYDWRIIRPAPVASGATL